MRDFTFGELWGPAPCHICGKYDYITQLNDEEEQRIAGMDGSKAANTIINEKLGKPICGKHRSGR